MTEHTNNGKITKYRKPLNTNIGMIIFGVLFIYIIICMIMYVKTDHLSGYEVKNGSLTVNNVYRGIAIREEKLHQSSSAGYIYYFMPEGSHVACGDLVYAIDSAGALAELSQAETSDTELTNSDLADLKSKIVNYRSNFDITNFSTVYDFKHELQNEVAKLNNLSTLNAIDTLSSASGVNKYYSDSPGALVFSTDGYEELTADIINTEHFNEETYSKRQFLTNDLVGNGDTIYKLVTDEDWELVIQVPIERVEELVNAEYVQTKFLKDQFVLWGKVTAYGLTEDGKNQFVGLSFTTSMINYITERFLDVELILEEDTGLKIPNSAIAEKNFFLVEKKFLHQSNINGKDGVLRETYTEDGDITTEFIETTIYNVEDDIYYLDESVLQIGDVLHMEESAETMTVSKQASLVGVYNINKGYADFKQIRILYHNDEYSIVESNTMYGLNCYDHIALDASSVVDDQFVYE